MKTLAITFRPAALTLALIVAAFLFPSQLELKSQKPVRAEFSDWNTIRKPEINPLPLTVFYYVARICLPVITDSEVGLYSSDPGSVFSGAMFCNGNQIANAPSAVVFGNSANKGMYASRVNGSDGFSGVERASVLAGKNETRMLSSAGWDKVQTEIAYKVESWMLNEAAWMEISGEPVETLENWMLDESTWSAGVSETPQKVESWMNDDITWVSGDFYAEEAQVVESWMLSTESWNEQFTARIK